MAAPQQHVLGTDMIVAWGTRPLTRILGSSDEITDHDVSGHITCARSYLDGIAGFFTDSMLILFQPDKSASLPAILAALVPSLTTAVILLTIFLIIKKPFRRIYSPRTYMEIIPEK